jgi:hypothetical protein
MRTLTRLVPLALLPAVIAGLQACGTVPNDTIPGNEFPPAGVIQGTVFYSGPPPCTQNGQIVGNAVILVFDRRNPPPPAGLANTAVNFGVVSGDVLFGNIPRNPGPNLDCPAADAAPIVASATYAISPMNAGSYVLQGFYDHTGDFLATFKFRNLPEATDIGGGYIDVNDPNVLVPTNTQPPLPVGAKAQDGGVYTPPVALEPKSASASYAPIFLPVDIGTAGATSPLSLRDVPDFTMPPNGYVASNVTVSIGSSLGLARPYFYPEGVIAPPGQANAKVTLYGSSATRPVKPIKTPANPSGDVDFVPVLSYPQDIIVDAQPAGTDTANVKGANEYQASLPQIVVHWSVPSAAPYNEFAVAADISTAANPFHMQFAANAPAGQAQGGNGGIYVFQFDSTDQQQFDIPEGSVPRMWPLIVLAKLEDDPNHTADPESVTYQGSDGLKPIVIIQGITLLNDSLVNTALPALNGMPSPLFRPDPSNLTDHVTVMLRPNVLCLDPRHVDQGGVLVTPSLCGPLPPDAFPKNYVNQTSCNPPVTSTPLGNILQPSVASQVQLTSLVKQSPPNPVPTGQLSAGLAFGCMPTGRYGVNVVYPTGQAWTTPNESGSCATVEGNTIVGAVGKLIDPGTCSTRPRPVLYSQGTRAVVEITPGTPGSCCLQGTTTNGVKCLPTAIPPVPTFCTTLTGD